MEQGGAPPVLVRLDELEGATAGQLSCDRRSHQRHHNKDRAYRPLRTSTRAPIQRELSYPIRRWPASASPVTNSMASGTTPSILPNHQPKRLTPDESLADCPVRLSTTGCLCHRPISTTRSSASRRQISKPSRSYSGQRP